MQLFDQLFPQENALCTQSNSQHVVGDFSYALTLPLILFHLTDICIPPRSGDSLLDRIIANHPDLFPLNLRAPISSNGHRLLLLGPIIYLSFLQATRSNPTSPP